MYSFSELTGHEIDNFIIWNFEYGKHYSGPDKDVLRVDRAVGDPEYADLSNFLHSSLSLTSLVRFVAPCSRFIPVQR